MLYQQHSNITFAKNYSCMHKRAKNHFFFVARSKSILCKHSNHIYRATSDRIILYWRAFFTFLITRTPKITFSYFFFFSRVVNVVIWHCGDHIHIRSFSVFVGVVVGVDRLFTFRLGEFSLIGN